MTTDFFSGTYLILPASNGLMAYSQSETSFSFRVCIRNPFCFVVMLKVFFTRFCCSRVYSVLAWYHSDPKLKIPFGKWLGKSRFFQFLEFLERNLWTEFLNEMIGRNFWTEFMNGIFEWNFRFWITVPEPNLSFPVRNGLARRGKKRHMAYEPPPNAFSRPKTIKLRILEIFRLYLNIKQ